jgi:hypothetical protein
MHVIACRRPVLTVFCTSVPGVPISLDLGHKDSGIPMSRPRAKCELEVLVADRQSSRPCWKLLWTLCPQSRDDIRSK